MDNDNLKTEINELKNIIFKLDETLKPNSIKTED